MLYPRQGNSTLRRGENAGCVWSLVDKNGVDYFYGIAKPNCSDSLRADVQSQVFSALENLQAALEELDIDNVVKLEVFLRNIGDKELVRTAIANCWGDALTPATTFVAQAPCDPQINIILFAVAVNSSPDSPNSMPISIYECGEHASVVEYDGVSFGFFGGIVPDSEPVGAYDRAFNAFSKLRAEIEANGFLFPHVFRTWLYQGHIVLPEGETQRYKELNRARTDFFYGTRFIEERLPHTFSQGPVYPASTGIGADDVDVAFGAIAIRTDRKDVILVPLENPNQTPAFDYAEFYSPKSPKFSRAMVVCFNERASVYVSGTASIVDQKTVHIGDAAKQTHQTLDNIAALIGGDNLARHGITGFDASLVDLVNACVYVKRPEDYETIRAICEERLNGVPVVYTFADVCRDDLLVEIEGIVACRLT